MASRFMFLCAAAFLCAAPALAASVSISITDTNGHPAAGAVVSLAPQAGGGSLPLSHLPQSAIIDQRNETFIPLVSVIQRGGNVVFTNNDTTMHQVYSFSAIKQFAFEIDEGQRSAPVVFDKPGVAAIGCNIHDQMITYVYVADTPFVTQTGADGGGQITGVPAGSYTVSVWHPQLAPGAQPPTATLDVASGEAKFALALSLTGPKPGMKHMHMGNY